MLESEAVSSIKFSQDSARKVTTNGTYIHIGHMPPGEREAKAITKS